MDIKKILEAQEQDQSIDTTFSVETAKVLDALVKWNALNDSVFKLEGNEPFSLVYLPLFILTFNYLFLKKVKYI